MPKINLENLPEELQKRVDKLWKKEYETTDAEKEVKDKLGLDAEVGVSDDSLERLAADVDETKKLVDFQMGGVVCLGRDDDGDWSLRWMVTPEIVA